MLFSANFTFDSSLNIMRTLKGSSSSSFSVSFSCCFGPSRLNLFILTFSSLTHFYTRAPSFPTPQDRVNSNIFIFKAQTRFKTINRNVNLPSGTKEAS